MSSPTSSSDAPPPDHNLLFGTLVALVIIILAIILSVYFVVIKKKSDDGAAPLTGGGTGNSSAGGNEKAPMGVLTGGDGSTVTTNSGETFTYRNSFGGYWFVDQENPFVSGVHANSWTPALNESWTWGMDHVNSVNLGGCVLYQPYPSAGDEWDLTTLMHADGTLQMKMEQHYDTFTVSALLAFQTEEDIVQIAGAGLNWVQVPIPFWAVRWSDVGQLGNRTSEAEPFIEGLCWKYIVRLFAWAWKYGIRVNLDLHTAPGSQNSRCRQVNFLKGAMGIANAQRLLDYICIITKFILQPEYHDVVQMFGVLNESLLPTIRQLQVSVFYLQVHDLVCNITSYSTGKGPYISFHDGFSGISSWAGFLPGANRVILDTHPYFAFGVNLNTEPIVSGEDPKSVGRLWPGRACQ
ncbi:Glycoside hydrolase family 5 protein [Mycena venus]|uniref:glucan 1,3-beta-glucosidase n=1 Tax=Mycena venus TaxID=2733690 RepID=A0A8H6X2H1_9AGAR|nr:Glycoside hydrolase family 5 protein [Mycena venus]